MERQYYKDYYFLENTHWWFVVRLRILRNLFNKHIVKNDQRLKILNVGVATGATSKMLNEFGDVTSVEYDKECCEFLNEELGISTIQASLTNLPFENNSFDVVCAFDVIEHIEDDLTAISEIKRVLKPNGNYFITVPAFNFLWSDHDVVNHHFRRYTKRELVDKLNSQKMIVSYSTYFNTLLFLPISFARIISNILPKKKNIKEKSDFEGLNSSGFINIMLEQIFEIENKILKNRKASFLFGVSLLTIGK